MQSSCAGWQRRSTSTALPFDRDVDAFLQACTVEGKASHPLTNFFLRILGLEVRQFCIAHPGGCQDLSRNKVKQGQLVRVWVCACLEPMRRPVSSCAACASKVEQLLRLSILRIREHKAFACR